MVALVPLPADIPLPSKLEGDQRRSGRVSFHSFTSHGWLVSFTSHLRIGAELYVSFMPPSCIQ